MELSYAEPIVSENETVWSWASNLIETDQDEADHTIETFVECL